MGTDLKRLECDPKCGFVVQSHDEREVIDVAKRHAKEKHSMDATDKQLRDMIKTVEAAVV